MEVVFSIPPEIMEQDFLEANQQKSGSRVGIRLWIFHVSVSPLRRPPKGTPSCQTDRPRPVPRWAWLRSIQMGRRPPVLGWPVLGWPVLD